jgi:hypothetical protein
LCGPQVLDPDVHLMGDVIHAEQSDLDGEDWGWLVGATVVALDHAEPYSWWFRFSNGGQCSVHGGTWTLSGLTGLIVSSKDHRQQFGLPAPVDSVVEAMAALRDRTVLSAVVPAGRPDLEIRLEGELCLALLALSRGYECWEATDPNGRSIVVSGSRAASWWREQS